jgi:hypothetical protein
MGGVNVQQNKVKVQLSGISQTMLGCLWGRAELSKRYSSLFYDEKATELVEKIDYDFSASDDMPFHGIWFNISHKLNLPEFGLFTLRARQFDGGEIVFNVIPRSADGFGAWRDILPPEQRDVMRTALVDALKDWWKKAPQGQKEKLNDTIATLDLPKKPNGKAWSDLEAWWNQLSEKETLEVMRGFGKSFRSGVDM